MEMKIAPPRTGPHPDRFLDCQEALSSGFAKVASTAVAAGWDPEEVAAALVELADHLMLGMIANRQLAIDLRKLAKR